jgi:hypothetical protein
MKTCTEDAEIVISGHKQQEAKMLAAMQAAPDGVVILWPPRPDGRDRNPPISVEQFKATHPQAVQQGLVVRRLTHTLCLLARALVLPSAVATWQWGAVSLPLGSLRAQAC